MPFLNGGLFIENTLDKIGFQLPDEIFQLLFDSDPFDSKKGFLERFNFTIREDTPLEVEVAVDPEMLGKVYESLISEEERGKAGIFYTPRVEIDFMCRLSLLEYLTEETGLSKSELLPLVFEPQTILSSSVIPAPPSVIPAKAGIQKGLSDNDLRKIIVALHKLRIVDPAVGSASFLVGMMNVLVEIFKNLYLAVEKKERNLFELKNQVISENLYGVDVKDWAVMVGELRLWLSLIIETDEKYLNIYNKPLLPSFTFKMRQGDSLVEEIGGKQLSLRGEFRHIPEPLRNKIEEIKSKKAEYFSSARHEWEKEIEDMEHELLGDILEDDIRRIDERIKARKKELESRPKEQIGLLKTKEEKEEAGRKKTKELEADIEKLEVEKKRLQEILIGVGKKKDYFLWEIDFAEVFAEKSGFDIVLGNPPYVRQEQIAFPLEREQGKQPDEWRERKRLYKEKLVNSSYLHWGNVLKIDKKSDLYVYFYYHGIALLKPKGTFCFINSNSWLDVGYGAGLQEFLLKRMEPLYVIDNIARRTFEADVNTVIVLIKRPDTSCHAEFISASHETLKQVQGDTGKASQLKFIAFKKPFEEVLRAETILEIENTTERTVTENYRITPKNMNELLLEGIEIPEEEEEQAELVKKDPLHMPYSGNKWGGKYLRAPEIYWTILEKGKGKLVKIGEIADVRFGIKTGADNFFYLKKSEAKKIGIEKEFMHSIFVSSDQMSGFVTNEADTDIVLITTDKSPKELKTTKMLEYIKRGESKAFPGRGGASVPAKRPSCKGHRPYWYSVIIPPIPPIYWMEMRRERYFTLLNKGKLIADHTFYSVYPQSNIDSIALCGLLNSTLIPLLVEVFANDPGGGGTSLQTPIREIKRYVLLPRDLLNSTAISKAFLELSKRECFSIIQECGINPARPVREQKPAPLPDRKALDDIVFDILGLTEAERNEVYWSVC